jgi:hypothetical protein
LILQILLFIASVSWRKTNKATCIATRGLVIQLWASAVLYITSASQLPSCVGDAFVTLRKALVPPPGMLGTKSARKEHALRNGTDRFRLKQNRYLHR